jgi:hypothetical protein
MRGGSKLQRIAPDELPDLLTRLDHRQTTDFALVGRDVRNRSPEGIPCGRSKSFLPAF